MVNQAKNEKNILCLRSRRGDTFDNFMEVKKYTRTGLLVDRFYGQTHLKRSTVGGPETKLNL